MLVHRYIFVLMEVTLEIGGAQRTRLGYAGWGNALCSAAGLAGAVMVRTMEQSLLTHEAMVARGYAQMFPFGLLPPLQRRAIAVLIGAVPGIGALYFMTEKWL